MAGAIAIAIASASATLCFSSQNPIKTLHFSTITHYFHFPKSKISAHRWNSVRLIRPLHGLYFTVIIRVCCWAILIPWSIVQFPDGSSEVELRLQLGGRDVQSAKDIFVDADGTSLTVKVRRAGSLITLIETNSLFEKIKPAETIWYIGDDQLVINLKKDPDLKWPDIMESWESSAGSMQLLKGTSIYIVGDSTEINQKVARELAVALGYTPLDTKVLSETFAKQTVDSCAEDDFLLASGGRLL
ncbi:hypothetical protein CRYUN_Cryun19dG0160600 [Craigia yunnanensis]